jgi:predicted ester cyclase
VSEADKATVNRIAYEGFNEGSLDVVDEVMSADFIDHNPLPGSPAGREGIKALILAARSAFPDLKNTVIHQVAEGDWIVNHVRSTGTMKGDFMGMKATGKSATWDAVHIARLRDGKVVEHWAVQDQLGMLQQLGLAPAPPAAKAA